VDCKPGSQGHDPPSAAPQAQLLHADPLALAHPANDCLSLPEPVRPGVLRPLPLIASGQQPLDEGPAPQDARIRQHPVPALAEGPDFGPAAQRAEERPAHQLGAAALGEPLPEERALGPERAALAPPEPREHVRPILPRVARAPQNPGMATPGGAGQVGQIRDEPRPQRIEVDVAHQLAEVGLLLHDDGFIPVLEEVPHPLVAAVVPEGVAREQPAQELREPLGPTAEQQMGMVGEDGPGVDGLPIAVATSPSRARKAARSSSSATIFPRSIPRRMTWCNVPGVSSRACFGIRELRLRPASRGTLSELFHSVNNVPLYVNNVHDLGNLTQLATSAPQSTPPSSVGWASRRTWLSPALALRVCFLSPSDWIE